MIFCSADWCCSVVAVKSFKYVVAALQLSLNSRSKKTKKEFAYKIGMAQAIPMLFIKIKCCKQRLNLMKNSLLKQLLVFRNALTTLVLPLIIVGLLFSCTKNYYSSKNTPPGQAKKSTGSKSAKHDAPGQQKKHY